MYGDGPSSYEIPQSNLVGHSVTSVARARSMKSRERQGDKSQSLSVVCFIRSKAKRATHCNHRRSTNTLTYQRQPEEMWHTAPMAE